MNRLDSYLANLKIVREGSDRIRASGILRPDFAGFQGHFPGKPILAGALQIEMLAILASAVVPPGWVVVVVGNTKFRKMIVPGEAVIMGASVQSPGIVIASLEADGTKACQTTFQMGPQPGIEPETRQEPLPEPEPRDG